MGKVIEHALSAIGGIAQLCHLGADTVCHTVEIGGEVGKFVLSALICTDMEASSCDILGDAAQLFERRIELLQEQIKQQRQKRGGNDRGGGKRDDKTAKVGIKVAHILCIGEVEAVIADGPGDEDIAYSVNPVACHSPRLWDFQVGGQIGMGHLSRRLKTKVDALGSIEAGVGNLKEMGGAALRILGIALEGRGNGKLLGKTHLLGSLQIGIEGIEGKRKNTAVQKEKEKDQGEQIGSLKKFQSHMYDHNFHAVKVSFFVELGLVLLCKIVVVKQRKPQNTV